MSARTPFIARPSTRWTLHAITILLGTAGLLCLAHFIFRVVVPALDRMEAPASWTSGVAALVLLPLSAVASAVAMVGSILARVERERDRPPAPSTGASR